MSETPIEAVDRLRALAAALRGRDTIAEETADDLADGLEAYLAGVADLESALGLKPAPGGRQWRTEKALAERDRILREAATLCWAGRPMTEQARQLALAIHRYAGSGWSRDRKQDHCPEHLHGKVQAHIWRALKARDRSLGERALRRILSAGLELPPIRGQQAEPQFPPNAPESC